MIRPFSVFPTSFREWTRFLAECFVIADAVNEYTVSTLPDVTKKNIIAVTNESGGYTLAFSDGINWRRVQDRAIVS